MSTLPVDYVNRQEFVNLWHELQRTNPPVGYASLEKDGRQVVYDPSMDCGENTTD